MNSYARQWLPNWVPRAGRGIVIPAVLLTAAAAETTPPVASAATEETAASSWQVLSTSQITLLGSARHLAAQTIGTGPGTPPKNWKTLSNLVLPRIPLAFGEYIDFVQNGTAQGVFTPSSGQVTLDLPLQLRDSTGASQSFTAYLTTGQTNGVGSDGTPFCHGDSQDPSVCRGTPRAASGSFRMVSIVNIPPGGGTRGSGALLLLEVSGSLTLSCTGVVCTASDACHAVGTCDPATGVCSNPSAPNGTACNDSNPCTRTDTCQSGTCTGSNPVVCTASDQCHVAGTCSAATGVCSNPNKSNGTTCNDSNACTRTDKCQSGVCTGSNPVVCTASDQCHAVGTCNTATGVCSNPNKSDGTTCNDSKPCTQTDTCQSGTCTGSNPVVCTASDQCHVAGVCNASTGVCSNPTKSNGTACNDSNGCTRTDTCQSGVCTGSSPVVCTASDQCHTAGTCTVATGICSNPNKSNGTTCNDSNACTRTDTCQSGTCTGSNPVVCTASDPCHDAGTCNASTGVCSNPIKSNGTVCNDANACTQTDTCQSGTCAGSNPVVCTASDPCHTAGTCNSTTGACSNPIKPEGTACNDTNACTQTDTCRSGACVGSNPVVCAPSEPCHTPAACNPGTGTCLSQPVPDGTACNDGSSCTSTDTCTNGSCAGVASPTLEVSYSVRLETSAGTTQIVWNPASGATVSDVARGPLSGLPVGAADSEACLGSGVSGATMTDVEVPPVGGGFWYVVRGNGPCGAGPYGFQETRGASPTPRLTAICESSCHTGADCPGTDTECRARICTAGACGFSSSPSGVPTTDQQPGDCGRNVCDGSGGVMSIIDNTDRPIDSNPCTNDVCTNGTPSHPPSAAGTPCSVGTNAGVCGGGSCELCGGSVQRCCASYPYCRPGLRCQSGFCR